MISCIMTMQINLSNVFFKERRFQRVYTFPDGISRVVSLPQWIWDEHHYLVHNSNHDPMEAAWDAAVNLWKNHEDFEVQLHMLVRMAIIDLAAMVRFGIPQNRNEL